MREAWRPRVLERMARYIGHSPLGSGVDDESRIVSLNGDPRWWMIDSHEREIYATTSRSSCGLLIRRVFGLESQARERSLRQYGPLGLPEVRREHQHVAVKVWPVEKLGLDNVS